MPGRPGLNSRMLHIKQSLMSNKKYFRSRQVSLNPDHFHQLQHKSPSNSVTSQEIKPEQIPYKFLQENLYPLYVTNPLPIPHFSDFSSLREQTLQNGEDFPVP